MLHFHAAHRNLVLDSQTYYPNLTDDVIAGGPLQFDGCFLDVPAGAGPRRRSRSRARRSTTRRSMPPRWPDARRRRRDDPYYDRDYLIRPRV